MEDLCTACLCPGRKLHFIGETGFHMLYAQILNEIPVYDTSQIRVRVCWECRAVLRRFQHFKLRAKTCYSQLLRHLHQATPKLPTNQPHLQVHRALATSYPNVKVEYDAADDVIAHAGDVTTHTGDVITHAGDVFGTQDDVKTRLDTQFESQDDCLRSSGDSQRRYTDAIFATHADTKTPIDVEFHTNDTKTPFDVEIGTQNDVGTHLDIDFSMEIIKSEDGDDTHCEPETFVNDLSVKRKGKKRRKETEKKGEVKVKKTKNKDPKVKVKKKPKTSKKPVHEENADDVTERCDVAAEVEGEAKTAEKKGEDAKLEVVKKSPRKRSTEELPERPECVECGKAFSSRKTYRYHLNVLHKGQNRYPCARCGKVYQWKSNLGRHMRTHKARDSGELYCELCDKRFASVATYRQHLRVSRRHVAESDFSFICAECGKKFVSKTRLRDHMDWEHLHNIKFVCQLCTKPFKCHTSLYVHLQNVHRNKEKRDNLCHVCGKSYQNAAKLKYHIVAMHTHETPYSCGQCGAAFGWYSSLYRHVREVHYKVKMQPNKKVKKGKRGPDEGPQPPVAGPPLLGPPVQATY